MSDESLAEQLVARTHSYGELLPELDFITTELLPFEGQATVLDFGCGVGRNAVGMCDTYPKWHITGYDSDVMIERAKGYVIDWSRISMTSDWAKLKHRRFDFVLAWTVFQHIHPDEVDQYAKDLLTMTDNLLIWGRWWIDLTMPRESVFSIFERYWALYNDVDTDNVSGQDHLYARYTPKS